MHPDSYKVMKDLVEEYGVGCTTVLDFGSRDVNGTYRDLFPTPWTYTGYDIQGGKNVDVVMSNPFHVPLPECSVDLIISGNTLEHVSNPFFIVSELARVMKGTMIIGAPFKIPEHRYPLDCWRFLPDGMRALTKYAKIECVEAFLYNNDCWLVARR